jgi:cardiolipin synthase
MQRWRPSRPFDAEQRTRARVGYACRYMGALLSDLLPVVGTLMVLAISLVASAHAILHKREVHASITWASLIWFAPVVGALAYVLVGRNRIRRRAAELRSGAQRVRSRPDVLTVPAADVETALGTPAPQLVELARVVEEATGRPLLPGNRIDPLVDGDEAYPEMLDAIARAERSVVLATYIFESGPVGIRFADALATAQDRGAQVRVLLDDVGVRYSQPTIDRILRKYGLHVARFLPAWRAPYFNLRNHRKLLIIDGKLGFTGGMNIRAGHVLRDNPDSPVRDLHFRVAGPVVAHLMEALAEDWEFTTHEALRGEAWFPPLYACGPSLARGIADGPDEEFDKIRWAFLGGIACARRSIRVLTPYFLPDTGIATAFNVAAMRGVRVDIVLPERGNLPIVEWAMCGHLQKVLGHGCRIWLTPPPFDHTKLMVVDDSWMTFGSPNWDPRSLRLNFELAVECYDLELAARMGRLIDDRIAAAREVTQHDLDTRPLDLRLRDGIARLLTPYL